MMPEWYLIMIVLAALSLLGIEWKPLRVALPVFVLCALVSVFQAISSATQAAFRGSSLSRSDCWKRWSVTAFLYLLQPMARLVGRVRHGLTLWRRQPIMGYALPRPWKADIWTERNQTIEERLESLEKELRHLGCVPIRGSDFDRWDLKVTRGLMGSARLSMALEHHGSGRALLRIHCQPYCSISGTGLAAALVIGSWGAALDLKWAACAALGSTGLMILVRAMQECAAAGAIFLAVVRKIERAEKIEMNGAKNGWRAA
jgi:hypothetical protein